MAGGKMWRPLLALCAVLVHGVLVDSVSVNIVNKLGEPLSYDCEAGSYADASMAPPSGTLTDSQKVTIYMGVQGSRYCNFWFESWNSGDLYQLEFHVCHYHAEEPDDVYEWTFRKTGIYLSDSDFKHQWRITRSFAGYTWSSE
ncbi:hypothetical protein MPTK1_8g05050 [Marchantia polymorpha subsp. ruderalis]|uniref:S-protein homolog n=1 Tax=Marchantia polymorpha TaxID=3197 RepID=A0A2R6WK89_MARPO|nr:hypothetical protein MARPO_0081s0006 [Marchantia polymorpha]BBN18737.1 hypothetical protein Mp_8g05050 [Marchantia polymorpha subsp. ruderalis]|eukprot:PTQ34275.1 hypothetical protein MARPO_0081s0006 [Marchantia polymorpha]